MSPKPNERRTLCQETEYTGAQRPPARQETPLPPSPVPPVLTRYPDRSSSQADIAAVKEAVSNENISAEELKEKVEALKKSSMKIGEAMYKNAGDSSAGGEQSAEYEDVKKDGEKKDDKKDDKKD